MIQQMSQLNHALVRAFVFASILLILGFVGLLVANSFGLRLTDWQVFPVIFSVFFILVWLFNSHVPAKCGKCGKIKSYCSSLSFMNISYICRSCGAVNSPPLHK